MLIVGPSALILIIYYNRAVAPYSNQSWPKPIRFSAA